MNKLKFMKLFEEIANDVVNFKPSKKLHLDFFQNWYEFGDFTILITYSETPARCRIRVSAIYHDENFEEYICSEGDYITESRFKCCLFVKLPYLIESACKEFFKNVT